MTRGLPKDYPDLQTASTQLFAREPIFHRPGFGTTRQDFEAMMAPEFWEVGASGMKYSKEFILDVLEERHRKPVEEDFQMMDFHCQMLAAGLFLTTYELDQSGRHSRRATLWRWTTNGWQIVYHQGTLIST